MDPNQQFAEEVRNGIAHLRSDTEFRALSVEWLRQSIARRYSYHFRWLGRPVIQYPQDLFAMQELIAQLKPDLLIETGVAHGGSLIFYASIMEMLGHGRVLGIDIDIRAHNRDAIESHPMSRRIDLLQGSSIDPEVVARVGAQAMGKRVMVVLDSSHTHAHVLEELRLYAPLVTPGSYCVVMDTVVEDMPKTAYPDRPWGPGDNPRTAVREFVMEDPRFRADPDIEAKLQITVCSEGWLQRVG